MACVNFPLSLRLSVPMNDFLVPEDSPFAGHPMFGRYHERVASALLPSDHGPRVEAVVACLPAFEPEWGVYLRAREGEGYTITVAEADGSFWQSEHLPDRDLPSVNRKSIDVTPEFARHMHEAFVNLLYTVANTNDRPRGVDGETYHFAAWYKTLSRLSGWTWSPLPSSVAGRLVDLVYRLRHVVLHNRVDKNELYEIGQAFEQFDAVPRYYVENKTTTGVLRLIERSKKMYRDGIITQTEFVAQINDTCEYHGYPPLADIFRLLRLIPEEAREFIAKQNQPKERRQ